MGQVSITISANKDGGTSDDDLAFAQAIREVVEAQQETGYTFSGAYFSSAGWSGDPSLVAPPAGTAADAIGARKAAGATKRS